MLSTKLKEAAGNSADATLYVDDVFSTYLYTGNGSTQTITNGIDLAGKGGMVWGKVRDQVDNHVLMDSARGFNKNLASNLTNPQTTSTPAGISANSNGFSLTTSTGLNESGWSYVSWTFREAPKFFDVVTYTGNGNGGGQNISHSLTSKPAFIIVKRTDASQNWFCLARASDTNYYTSASGTNDFGLNTSAGGFLYSDQNYATATTFNPLYLDVGNNNANINGATYVAYLYAHDTSSTGIIQCGSYTADGSGIATVNLGWEPQWLLYKDTGSSGEDWAILDSMRGWTVSGVDSLLRPNLTAAEVTANRGNPTAAGFYITGMSASSTYIYMAIRMPNKPPTSGTQVYNAIARTGNSTVTTLTGLGFTPDFLINANRNRTSSSYSPVQSRLTGAGVHMYTSLTNDEATDTNGIKSWGAMDGIQFGNDSTSGAWNWSGAPYINWFFKRASKFFDVVCYTGTGTNLNVNHNLTVAPELMIVKSRSASGQDWVVYNATLGNTGVIWLNQTTAANTGYGLWNNTSPTSTVFTVAGGGYNSVNASGSTYVAYLFATLAGISKVGSYTGNGSSQNIECGFAAGARFFLVKATSTTGSWWVWDSARGITAGNDPALQLNSTAAEITTADAVDPYAAGITVNQEATCSINASGVAYIFLAVS
jgi:hypothetical protein